MSSVIHFKFRSSKNYDTVVFEGAFISVGDLKTEIVMKKKMEKATDFDLVVTNAQTNEEYADEKTLVAKNTSVIVRRIPATRMMNFARNTMADMPAPAQRTAVSLSATSSGKEEDRIKEFVELQSGWGGPDYNPTAPGARRTYAPRHNDGRPPPPNYVCHRCGKPGHYISNCPTNGDATFDRPKARAPTGIPRAFLKAVEDPEALSGGALLMPGGGFAVMTQGNSAEFDKLQSAVEAGSTDDLDVPHELECPLCREILTDTVMSSCCGTNFCDKCLRRAMLQTPNLICPKCKKPNKSLDQLTANMKVRQKVADFKAAGGQLPVRRVRPSGPPAGQPRLPPSSLPNKDRTPRTGVPPSGPPSGPPPGRPQAFPPGPPPGIPPSVRPPHAPPGSYPPGPPPGAGFDPRGMPPPGIPQAPPPSRQQGHDYRHDDDRRNGRSGRDHSGRREHDHRDRDRRNYDRRDDRRDYDRRDYDGRHRSEFDAKDVHAGRKRPRDDYSVSLTEGPPAKKRHSEG